MGTETSGPCAPARIDPAAAIAAASAAGPGCVAHIYIIGGAIDPTTGLGYFYGTVCPGDGGSGTLVGGGTTGSSSGGTTGGGGTIVVVPVAPPQLVLNGSASSGTYTTGQSWTLTLSSGLANTAFSLCAIDNHAAQTCTPWGTTNSSGAWTGTGAFATSSVGPWTEWASFPSKNTSSNRISFVVNERVGSSGVPSALVSCDAAASLGSQLAVLENAVSDLATRFQDGGTPPALQAALGVAYQTYSQQLTSIEAQIGSLCGVQQSTSVDSAAVQFPVTVLVLTPTLYVRSAPDTAASLAGSQILSAGDTFTAVDRVSGVSVDGNALWWVSSAGNYVWSGGTRTQ